MASTTEPSDGMQPRAELRLAVTMTGGVSLAVWMGGVATEMLAMVRSGQRATSGRYTGLLNITRFEPRIDIISGSSAGGINGALLAFAIANDVPSLEGVRALWLDDGDLGKLLRPVDEIAPPSLLRGDEFFLEKIRNGFKNLRTKPPGKGKTPVRLFITSTMLTGRRRRIPDAFGSEVVDTDHKALFSFEFDPDKDSSHLTDRDAVDRLALACRASASFPGAFEASSVPIADGPTTLVTGRPDMGPVLCSYDRFGEKLSGSRWMVDGGVLVNKPLKPAIDAIFAQEADTQVRRVLAYVVPDPGETSEWVGGEVALKAQVDKFDGPPSLAEVIGKSVVSLPRNESVAAELDRLIEHNEKVRLARRTRDRVVVSAAADLVGVAARLVEAYIEVRAVRSVERILFRVSEELSKDGGIALVRPDWTVNSVRDALYEERKDYLPHAGFFFPGGALHTPGGDWRYGIRTAVRVAATVVDFVHRIQKRLPISVQDESEELKQQRKDLSVIQKAAHEELRNMRKAEGVDKSHWEHHAREMRKAENPRDWAKNGFATWGGGGQTQKNTFTNIGDAALASAKLLVDLQRVFSSLLGEIGEKVSKQSKKELDDLARVISNLTADGSTGHDLADDTLRRLLALEVVQLVGAGEEVVPQEVELIQISGYTADSLSEHPRMVPTEKLAGVKLGHFGAFLKRSWRANDWMWGRLDGAARLVDVLLDPHRLLQCWFGNREDLIGGIRATLVNQSESWLADYFDREWNLKKSKVWDELEFLNGLNPPGPMTTLRELFVKQLQLAIILDELPEVYFAIERDCREGAHVPPTAWEFRARLAGALGLSLIADKESAKNSKRDAARRSVKVGDLIKAFDSCLVGKELLSDEIGSDQLTELSAGAGLVMSGALTGRSSGLGFLRQPLRVIRGVMLLLYSLARLATGGGSASRTRLVIETMLFAAAGAFVGVALFGNEPGFGLSVIGLVALAGVLILAALRNRGSLTLPAVLVPAFLVVVAVRNIKAIHIHVCGTPPLDGTLVAWIQNHEEVMSIAVAVLAFALVGSLSCIRSTEPVSAKLR